MTDLVFADLVQETTTTEGTGNIVPNGAVAGNRTFADALTTGDQFYYSIDGGPADPLEWEVGIGTFNSSGEVERAPIISSAGTSPVDLSPGTKTIQLTVAAEFFARVQADDVFAAWQALPGNEGGTVADFLVDTDHSEGAVMEPPAVEDNAFSRIMIDQQAPTAGMTNSAGGNDAVNARLILNGGEFTQGPTGETNYYDTVLALGLNLANNYTPVNSEMPSASYRIESKFAQGGATDPFMSEFHTSLFPTDYLTAGEFRLISGTIPHNSAKWDTTAAALGTRAAVYNQLDGVARSRIYTDLRTGFSVIDYKDGGSGDGHPILRFNSNNRPALQQLNAAGTSYLPLVYRNQYDNHYFSGGAIYVVTATQALPTGDTAAFVFNITSGATNQSALVLGCPPVTGIFFGVRTIGSASDKLIQQMYNNGAGAGLFEFQMLNGSGNDGVLAFSNVGGGESWVVGYDNSDGDKLKIEKSYRNVGTAANLFVEFDPAKNVSYFAKPPKLPSYTVSALPSAATVGAGAMAFCTNETGGSVPCFSDGTDWRRVTDRAIVS